MDYKFLLVEVVLTALSLHVNAQSIRNAQNAIRPDIHVEQPEKPTRQSRPVRRKKIATVKQDTVFCFQTKKQHGWFVPVGELTKEEASHRNISYRFTNRNSKGHWCKMELIDGYGNYTTGGMSPYILKINSADTDSLANSDWVEKVKKECIYEFIADPTGENIIQERAYDKDLNIIYTYSRTPIGIDSNGHKRFVGSYRDCYGLPAEMRKDTTNTYTYGTLVMLTEDVWGNDSIIEYMDAKGHKKFNSDGVAMEVFICDKDGHQLMQQSRDENGNLKIDNWGNCGIEYVWNANHTISSATYVDDKWQPMRLPSLRNNHNGRDNVIRTKYKYDGYGRQVEEAFFTESDVPDTNKNGTHKTLYEYDHRGNLTRQASYDINGNASAYDDSGTSEFVVVYDDKGNSTDVYFKDKYGKPTEKEGFLSRRHQEYDDTKEILDEQYIVESGKEKLIYKKEITKNYIYTLWQDGSYRVDSLDSKGRTTFVGFYDSEGQAEMVDGRAYERCTYIDDGRRTIKREINYDTNGNPVDVNGICKSIVLSDTVTLKDTRWYYDKNDNLIQTYAHQEDGNFEWPLAEYDMNSFGVICRAGGTAGVRHYKADVLYTQEHQFATFVGRDEFGEPDYITSDGGNTYYYQKMSRQGYNVFYDENNNPINDFESLRDTLPKILTIEVIDSVAYRLGLKDNDVIVSYGNYVWPVGERMDYHSFRALWALDCVSDASKSKKMIVFRVNPETLEYGITEIDGLKGSPSELGFLAHVRFLTQKQEERIRTAIKDELYGGNESIAYIDSSKKKERNGRYIVVGIPDMYRNERLGAYASQIADPTLLIAASVKDRDQQWLFSDGTDKLEDFFYKSGRLKISQSYPRMTFYLSKDFETIVPLYLDERTPTTRWLDVQVSDEEYLKMKDLAKLAQTQLKKEGHTGEYVKPKQLVGKWIGQIKAEHGDVELDYMFAADGSVSIHATSEVKFPLSDDVKAIINVSLNVSGGTWGVEGSFILIDLEDDISNVSIGDIDIIGIDNDKKEETLAMLRSYIEQNKDEFVGELDLDKIVKTGELRVNNLKSGVMELENLQLGNSIVFAKFKN